MPWGYKWFLLLNLAKTHFKNTMELSDPPFLPLGQGLIVDMGVTDENIIHESFPDEGFLVPGHLLCNDSSQMKEIVTFRY